MKLMLIPLILIFKLSLSMCIGHEKEACILCSLLIVFTMTEAETGTGHPSARHQCTVHTWAHTQEPVTNGWCTFGGGEDALRQAPQPRPTPWAFTLDHEHAQAIFSGVMWLPLPTTPHLPVTQWMWPGSPWRQTRWHTPASNPAHLEDGWALFLSTS